MSKIVACLWYAEKAHEAASFYVSRPPDSRIDSLTTLPTDSPSGSAGPVEQCGWLKDRYGVSWQIVPIVLGEMMRDPDRTRVKRVADAMLGMVKLDIADLEKVYGAKA